MNRLGGVLWLCGWCLLLSGCATPRPGPAVLPEADTYTFAGLEELLAAAPRPVVVFLHTDWCVYCQNMKRTSLRHPEVVERLNRDYYFISFDAESRSPVRFAGQRYGFRPKGLDLGVHTLAEALGGGDEGLIYPTLVVLNTELTVVFRRRGFLSGKALADLLAQSR